MSNKSVYKFIRPIVVICAVLGSFCATNITSEESLDLKFKLLSFPLVVYCVQAFLNLYVLSETVRYYSTLDVIGLDVYLVLILAYQNVWTLYQLLGTKQVIKSIQTIDRLRENIISSSIYRNNKLTNPLVFNSIIVICLIIDHFSSFPLRTYLYKPKDGVLLSFVFFVLVMCFVIRQAALYSCVYYSCALAVYDTVQVWRHNSKVRPLQTGFIHEFYKLLVSQVQLLKEVDLLLRNYILFFLVGRLITLSFQSVRYIDLESVFRSTMISRIHWLFVTVLLVLPMGFAFEEFKKLEEEVFLLDTKNLSNKEFFKMRVLLNQLEDSPGVFTAAGFVAVGPLLLLTLTALGIEYFIMFIQNVDMLRDLHNLTPELIIKTH